MEKVTFDYRNGRGDGAWITQALFDSTYEYYWYDAGDGNNGDVVVCHAFCNPFYVSLLWASKAVEAGALVFKSDSVVEFFLIIIYVPKDVVSVLVVIID